MANPFLPNKLNVARRMRSEDVVQVVKQALDEDPTVFQYDEIYEDIRKERSERESKAPQPKFIAEWRIKSERLQREHERHTGKLVRKKRAQEAEKFRDKKALAKTPHREKSKERRQDVIDEMRDVTKQENLSRSDRHYRSTVVDQPKKSGRGRGDRDFRSRSRDRERHSRRDSARNRDHRNRRDDKRDRDGKGGHRSRRHDREDRKRDSKSGSSAKVGSGLSSKGGQSVDQRPREQPIWKKRSPGQDFEAARGRYLERKRNGIVGPAQNKRKI